MSRALDLPEKETYQLVRLDHAGGIHGFTDHSSDIQYDDGILYLSTPSMEVKLAESNGTLEPKKSTLELPREEAICVNLTRGLPHQPVFVTVREVYRPTSGGPAAHSAITFRGQLTRSILNYQGDRDRILFEMQDPKSFLTVPLGIQCNHTCDHAFGDGGCKKNLGVLTEGGTVTDISGSVVTITGLSAHSDNYWRKGTVERNGLVLDIRDWDDSDPSVFYLNNEPQPSWVGQIVVVTPGCSKSQEECDTKWSNLENFRGAGFAIPPYNPNLEIGG